MTEIVKNPVVLLADDDPDYLFQIRFALEKAGFIVEAKDSQDEAELYLTRHRPDIAVFDLMMEKDDSGFILAYHAKRKYPDLPVILLTAVMAETGRNFGLNDQDSDPWIKADLYLEKGLLTEILISHINTLINR